MGACIFDQLACFLEPADEIVVCQFTTPLKLKKLASRRTESAFTITNYFRLRPFKSKICQAVAVVVAVAVAVADTFRMGGDHESYKAS